MLSSKQHWLASLMAAFVFAIPAGAGVINVPGNAPPSRAASPPSPETRCWLRREPTRACDARLQRLGVRPECRHYIIDGGGVGIDVVRHQQLERPGIHGDRCAFVAASPVAPAL